MIVIVHVHVTFHVMQILGLIFKLRWLSSHHYLAPMYAILMGYLAATYFVRLTTILFEHTSSTHVLVLVLRADIISLGLVERISHFIFWPFDALMSGRGFQVGQIAFIKQTLTSILQSSIKNHVIFITYANTDHID